MHPKILESESPKSCGNPGLPNRLPNPPHRHVEGLEVPGSLAKPPETQAVPKVDSGNQKSTKKHETKKKLYLNASKVKT